MKLTITNSLSLFVLVSSLVGCGAFSDETKIEIQMYGIAKAPSTATGDHDPQFQTYEVQSITLEGAVPETLVGTSSNFKIVDRPQILVTRDTAKLVGTTYTGMTVVFGTSVIGGDNEESELSFTLSQPTLNFAETIAPSSGKTQTFVIKASWENTMGAGAMTEPVLEITRQ